MPTLTLSIPVELKDKMDKLSEINWSEIARRAISEKVKEYLVFEKLVSESKLTEEDASKLGKLVNRGLHKRYKELYKELK